MRMGRESREGSVGLVKSFDLCLAGHGQPLKSVKQESGVGSVT